MDYLERKKDRLRPLLSLNDKLRRVLRNEGDINVSTIIVVGDQSHGKTSVIEGLTGLSLPRGIGIQTRAPTEIRLKQISKLEDTVCTVSYDLKEDKVEKPFDLKNLDKVIRDAQHEIIGNKYGVTTQPIYVEIQQYDHEDLTIVDLPGVTRAKMKDQTEDIEKTILSMYSGYMKHEETIIVNVCSAMVDFSTSASLKLANEYDKNAKRTVLCLTKVDQHHEKGLRDKIENAIEMMNINPENLFLVRNRTQEEIENNLSMQETRRKELDYLNTNSELSYFPDTMKGIDAFGNKLIDLQYEGITACLSKNKQKLEDKLEKLVNEKATLGTSFDTEYECLISFQYKLNEINNKIIFHHKCLVETDTDFYEREFPANEENVVNNFGFLAFNKFRLEFSLNNFENPNSITVKSEKDCTFLFELRQIAVSSFKEIHIKANKAERIDIPCQKSFTIKLIVRASNYENNIFNDFWKIEKLFKATIDNKYEFSYFTSDQFMHQMFLELENIGKGFGLPAQNENKMIEIMLKKFVLKSVKADCLRHIDKIHDYTYSIYESEIKGLFSEFPRMNNKIKMLLKRFFEEKKEKALEYFQQIFDWLMMCNTWQKLYEIVNSDLHFYNLRCIDIYTKLDNKAEFHDKIKDMQPNFSSFNYKDMAIEEVDYFFKRKELKPVLKACEQVWAYWYISKEKLIDNILCMCRNIFINDPMANILKYISNPEFFKRDKILDLMRSDDALERKRKQNQISLDRVEEALKSIEDYYTYG